MSKLRIISKIKKNESNILKQEAQMQNNSWLGDSGYYNMMSKNPQNYEPDGFVNEMQGRIPSSITPNSNVYKNNSGKSQNILNFFRARIAELDEYIRRTDITEQQRQNARAHKYYIMVQAQAVKNKFGMSHPTNLSQYYHQYVQAPTK